MNETHQRLKTLLDGEIGKPLKDYLLNALNELKDIDNIKDYSNAQDQALEVKAQKKAYEKMKEVLSIIMTVDDTDGNPSTEEDYSS